MNVLHTALRDIEPYLDVIYRANLGQGCGHMKELQRQFTAAGRVHRSGWGHRIVWLKVDWKFYEGCEVTLLPHVKVPLVCGQIRCKSMLDM